MEEMLVAQLATNCAGLPSVRGALKADNLAVRPGPLLEGPQVLSSSRGTLQSLSATDPPSSIKRVMAQAGGCALGAKHPVDGSRGAAERLKRARPASNPGTPLLIRSRSRSGGNKS